MIGVWRRRSSMLLALALAVSPSCRESEAPSSEADATELHQVLAASAAPGILDRMHAAPFDVAYTGRRRLELVVPRPDGTPWTMVMEERVTSDGQGRFAVDPLGVSEPALSSSARDSFALLQKARQGFLYRYRDFRVRDLALATQTWTVRDSGHPTNVAGRSCVELEFSRRRGVGSRYVASIDLDTGLVLAWSEYGLDGQRLSRVEFQEIEFAAPAIDADWATTNVPGQVIEDGASELAATGFEPAHPRLLPAGFRRIRTSFRDESGSRFLWREYGDGIESLFFVHGRPLDVGSPTLVGAPVEPALVRVATFGAWTIAEHVRANGEVVIVMGKVGEAELLRTLRSAL